MPRFSWVKVLPFVALGIVVLAIPLPNLSTPQTHVIDMDAAQYEFSPGRLKVNEGDTIIFNLSASDVVHGFYLEGYDIEQRLEPGLTEQVTVTVNRRGKFRYRCSVSCGSLHPFMLGELVVGPNTPFWRAIGLTLVALIGTLMNLRIFEGEISDEQSIQTT